MLKWIKISGGNTIFFHRSIRCILIPLLLGWTSAISAREMTGQEIAIIVSQDLPLYRQAIEGFRRIYLGKVREYDLKGDPQEAENVIAFLKEHPPDLILTVGLVATRVGIIAREGLGREGLEKVPIIFCMVLDPDRFSLSGERMTGVTLQLNPSELFSKIKLFFPETKKIGVLYDPGKNGKMISSARETAGAEGISLLPVEVDSESKLPDAVRSLIGKADLLWIIPDSTVVTPESLEFLFLASIENSLPMIAFSDDLVKRGAVASFFPDYRSIGEEAGRLVLKILAGEDPSRIPIRSAPTVRFSINLKMIKKMGIPTDEKAFKSADQVYE
ncbi:MAG: ABC transporter substrate-binding protein [Candidatus Manganitrophaceae bacterium]